MKNQQVVRIVLESYFLFQNSEAGLNVFESTDLPSLWESKDKTLLRMLFVEIIDYLTTLFEMFDKKVEINLYELGKAFTFEKNISKMYNSGKLLTGKYSLQGNAYSIPYIRLLIQLDELFEADEYLRNTILNHFSEQELSSQVYDHYLFSS